MATHAGSQAHAAFEYLIRSKLLNDPMPRPTLPDRSWEMGEMGLAEVKDSILPLYNNYKLESEASYPIVIETPGNLLTRGQSITIG